MPNELWAGWDSMPDSYDISQSCEDASFLRAKMEAKSQRLFSSDEDVIKIVQVLANENGRYPPFIRSFDSAYLST